MPRMKLRHKFEFDKLAPETKNRQELANALFAHQVCKSQLYYYDTSPRAVRDHVKEFGSYPRSYDDNE